MSFLSALEVVYDDALYRSTFTLLYFTLRVLLLQEFSANSDAGTEKYHYLTTPLVARYVRFHPLEWHRHVSMRAGLLGCPYTGRMQCDSVIFTDDNLFTTMSKNIRMLSTDSVVKVWLWQRYLQATSLVCQQRALLSYGIVLVAALIFCYVWLLQLV